MNESEELDCHLVFVFNIHIENINNHLLRVRHIGLRQSRKSGRTAVGSGIGTVVGSGTGRVVGSGIGTEVGSGFSTVVGMESNTKLRAMSNKTSGPG